MLWSDNIVCPYIACTLCPGQVKNIYYYAGMYIQFPLLHYSVTQFVSSWADIWGDIVCVAMCLCISEIIEHFIDTYSVYTACHIIH